VNESCPMHQPAVLYDEDFFADPYQAYAALHAEGPVHRVYLTDGVPVWLVTDFETAREALRDPRLSRRDKHAGEGLESRVLPEPLRTGNLLVEDPPEHTRLRRFMKFAFTAKRVEAMEPWVRAHVEECLDAVEGGKADLMAALAAPLPINVIAELLGVPEEHRGKFRGWADALLGDDRRAAAAAGGELLMFCVELIHIKRAAPGDDLISAWLSAADEEGDALTGNELLGMIFILVVGGFDTTVGAIGNVVAALLGHPGNVEELREHPERIPAAVDELLRYDGSVHSSVRYFAMEPMAIAGTAVAAGDAVVVAIGAANQDPKHYPEPRKLDFARDAGRNLAFGNGPHHCPGEHLARLEIHLSVEALLRRFPKIALAGPSEELRWRRSHIVRVLERLPVVV
jgi:cytochrome P450